MAKFELHIASLSDTGLKRDNNEDSISTNASKGIAILADGMGGYMAGEIASAIAVTTLQERLEEAVDNGFSDANEGRILSAGIEVANHAIYTAAQGNPMYQHMGTTLVSVLLSEDTIHYAHVGDSRLYRLRENQLTQITADHSLVNELLEKGFYTEEEAANADNKNVITRAMGVKPQVRPDVDSCPAIENDTYLMCSDGLTDLVEDQIITEILINNRDSAHNACEQLVELANNNGGKDNVSVIVMQIRPKASEQKSTAASVVDWLFKH